MDGEEATQATQTVLDPRRVGKQNSGFSDDDVSDILCVLYPTSDCAKKEIHRLAFENSPHVVGKEKVDGVEPDYDLEDHASRFDIGAAAHSSHAITLRLSSVVKDPARGFTFGRNTSSCDIVFAEDPRKRISNTHFRIFVNEHGYIMLEDLSTNGTYVDKQHLCRRSAGQGVPITKHVLSSGAIIALLMHQQQLDITFRVRIPRRDIEYEHAYQARVQEYFAKHRLHIKAATSPTPPAGGPVDLFPRKQAAREATTTHQSPPRRIDTRKSTSSEWPGSDNYNKVSTIGRGAFAVVHKVTSKYEGIPYAAKEIDKRRFIKNGLDQKFENEMNIMRRVNHPNIVRYIESLEWENRFLILIMEFVPGGDLGKFILDNDPLPEDVSRTAARQLLSALGYLHQNNITHRDVKPDNILINTVEPFEVKLTDFGLSKMVETERTFLRTFCGTLLYCAPEVYTEYLEYDDNGVRTRGRKMRKVPGQRYSHAVDIWSLGGVLFYSLTGSPPYPVSTGTTYSELLHKIMSTLPDVAPLQRHGVTAQAVDFLFRMLQRRPENRASIKELEEHAWLRNSVYPWEHSQMLDEEADGALSTRESSLSFRSLGASTSEMYASFDEALQEGASRYGGVRVAPEAAFPVSAVASSGAMPAHRSRELARDYSPEGTEALGLDDDRERSPYIRTPEETDALPSDEDEAYKSGEAEDLTETLQRTYPRSTKTLRRHQSADQLQSLVDDVASQSLGDHEPTIQGLATLSKASLNNSKRKPVPSESSTDMEYELSLGEPTMKRVKSDGGSSKVSDELLEEFKLLSCVPPIRRSSSGRQIDSPVSKMTFWQQDRRTWHLEYPEMTQLQHDAFSQAARERGEEFAPQKSPLWNLAMKYFAPTQLVQDEAGLSKATGCASWSHSRDQVKRDMREMPSTAVPNDQRMAQCQTSNPAAQIVVPVPSDHTSRAIAVVESHPDSCIQGISFPITDAFASFGRDPGNTILYQDWQEKRLPKFALRVLLWKKGYDPSQNPSKTRPPWLQAAAPDDESYLFWISTKATHGIRINGHLLASSDAKNPSSPSQHWAPLHDGDVITVWGGPDPSGRDAVCQTTLAFRCFWGGSAAARSPQRQQLQLASPATAQALNTACRRTERRILEAVERRRKQDAAAAQDEARKRNVESERDKGRTFEKARQRALEYLASVQGKQSRRGPSYSRSPSATTASLARTVAGRYAIW